MNKIIITSLLIVLLLSCKKFVEVGPPETSLTTASVFTSDNTALSAITGIYSQMINGGFASGDAGSFTYLAGLSADELTLYAPDQDLLQFYNNGINPANFTLQNLWSQPYQYIYAANAVLAGLSVSNGVSSSVKNQLTGEAKFIRAFCYFYLVNAFGDVPLVLSTNYQVNATIPRSKSALVYNQLISDLLHAQGMLPADFSVSQGERVRPNQWAATALLARAYLYTGDWKDAETQASLIIGNTALFSLDTDLNAVFLKNSNEAIWQMMPDYPGRNTNEGAVFIITSDPENAALSPQLLAAFEPGDSRRTAWVDSISYNGQWIYFPFKYKVQYSPMLTEYSMVLRLAEQYLIRGEARAQQGNVSGAAEDLNTVRNRASLPNTVASDKGSLITAINRERQVELFTEWGHRWLDLKRTGQASAVLDQVKGQNWQATDTLYPIPLVQMQNDKNIIQNPGY